MPQGRWDGKGKIWTDTNLVTPVRNLHGEDTVDGRVVSCGKRVRSQRGEAHPPLGWESGHVAQVSGVAYSTFISFLDSPVTSYWWWPSSCLLQMIKDMFKSVYPPWWKFIVSCDIVVTLICVQLKSPYLSTDHVNVLLSACIVLDDNQSGIGSPIFS